jgi:hypothetical protein
MIGPITKSTREKEISDRTTMIISARRTLIKGSYTTKVDEEEASRVSIYPDDICEATNGLCFSRFVFVLFSHGVM